jgi:hypothetical protein
MSEDKFFQMVQGKLENFSPEVPQAAYAGMRRKYAVSKFMSWNAGRLNVWYALLLVGVASAGTIMLNTTSTEVAIQSSITPIEVNVQESLQQANASTEGNCIVMVAAKENCSAKSCKAKNNNQVEVPLLEMTTVQENIGDQIITENFSTNPVTENTEAVETQKIEEIVKVKEQPAKPKTLMTIPVYEKRDK